MTSPKAEEKPKQIGDPCRLQRDLEYNVLLVHGLPPTRQNLAVSAAGLTDPSVSMFRSGFMPLSHPGKSDGFGVRGPTMARTSQ